MECALHKCTVLRDWLRGRCIFHSSRPAETADLQPLGRTRAHSFGPTFSNMCSCVGLILSLCNFNLSLAAFSSQITSSFDFELFQRSFVSTPNFLPVASTSESHELHADVLSPAGVSAPGLSLLVFGPTRSDFWAPIAELCLRCCRGSAP